MAINLINNTLTPHFEKLMKENKKLRKEEARMKLKIDKLEEKMVDLINTDDIADAAGEDREYFKNVCCATMLGTAIKENKQLKADIKALIEAGEKSIKWNEERYNDLKTLAEDKHAICQKFKKENKELKEKITCLESDSHNEVSQAEFDDMKEGLESQIKHLASQVEQGSSRRQNAQLDSRRITELITKNNKLYQENKALKDWEHISKGKTAVLKKHLPDYCPEFCACDPAEHLDDLLTKLKKADAV